MWMAVGVMYVAFFRNIGGFAGIEQVIPVNERFNSQEQCTAYVNGLNATLQKTPRGVMKATVECISIPGTR